MNTCEHGTPIDQECGLCEIMAEDEAERDFSERTYTAWQKLVECQESFGEPD